MKKLLVLALSAIMVLSMAAVSMGAVTVGGEVVVKYDLEAEATSTSGKVKFTAEVNDTVTAYTELAFTALTFDPDDTVEGDEIDLSTNLASFGDTYFKILVGEGTLQTGKFGFGPGGLDLLGRAADDLKGNVLTTYEMPVAEGITAKLGYALQEEAFALNVAYAGEALGVGVYFQDTGAAAAAMALNVSYLLSDAFKVYMQYGTKNDDVTTVTVLGAKYTGENGLGAILEYDLNSDDDNNDLGLRVSYAFANSVALEFNTGSKFSADDAAMVDYSNISFKVAF